MELKSAAQLILSPRYQLREHGRISGASFIARLMQGSISIYRLNSFRHILEESNVYELNGFDIAKSNPTYKFDETPVSIRHRAYCFCWGSRYK
ncbi:unnamed protein product [Brassica rapa]|uniref:Uncharacterized protein n=1 Tax=Brassica campestris TaxID=3711 RepID=A0A8D9D0Z2_BRACM|nr:unnamed protein product [Brassica rapa]